MKLELFLLVLSVFSAKTDQYDEPEEERPVALPKYPLPQYTENGTILWFPRIIGGTPAILVSVQSSDDGSHFCGGTLINDYNVLTAAHCVTNEVSGRPQPKHARSMLVMAGDLSISRTNPSPTRQRRNVVFVFYHPSYSPITLINDIAILRLIHPFTYSTVLQSITFSDFTPTTGTNCRLAGWGSTEENGPSSIELLSVNLQIVSNDVCSGNQELNGLISEGMLCAGSESRSCQGDSGGGLICNEVVAGVVSFGNGCGRPNLQDVYTDVSFYKEWIVEALSSGGRSVFTSFGLISFLIMLIQTLKYIFIFGCFLF